MRHPNLVMQHLDRVRKYPDGDSDILERSFNKYIDESRIVSVRYKLLQTLVFR